MSSRLKNGAHGPHREAAPEERDGEFLKLAYAAAHDLNSPLRKIVSFGDLLKARVRGKLDEVELDYLERMLNAPAEAAKIVADLLTLSRVVHETLPVEEVDLDAVFAGVRSELAAEIAASGARIEAGRLLVLNGHSFLFHSLLFSLVSNAVKFRSPDRPLLVRVDSRRDGESIEIAVADNGIGFDPGYAEKIFQPFMRLNAKGAFPGNGIGLAIGRAVARRFGGSLTAVSEPDRGSTFTLRLPAKLLAR